MKLHEQLPRRNSLSGLSLRDLEYVEAVAELQHFGRAAERCNVSQPALSEQVRKLETHLGVAIFERTKRRVAITTQGAILLQQIDRILAEARNLMAMGRQNSATLNGILLLGAIETLGPYYLPTLLQQLRRDLPDIALRLTENRTAALIERLRHGALDVILAVTTPDMPGLASAPIFFEPFYLATPRDHPLGSIAPIRLESLPTDDLLLLEEGHCLRDQALSLCAGAPRATRHATSLETLWHMIAAGEGYSLLPALAIAARPDIARLVACRRLDQPHAGRMISLIWRMSDPRESQFRALAALLAAHLPSGAAPNLS
ncbi:MAG: LysR substrate-binding domain-containing protein [Acidocella sp.]|nr:LysR substrate-binding domain-containing protein [Acidocella sp.]